MSSVPALPDPGSGQGFRESVLRVVRPGAKPLSTDGNRRVGGRYNSPGSAGFLYCAVEWETAVAEVAGGLRARGVDPRNEGSWWCYEIAVETDNLLDMTSDDVLRELRLSTADLVTNDHSIPRRVGFEARARGYQALLVPSAARPGAKNLVILDPGAVRLRVRNSRPVKLV